MLPAVSAWIILASPPKALISRSMPCLLKMPPIDADLGRHEGELVGLRLAEADRFGGLSARDQETEARQPRPPVRLRRKCTAIGRARADPLSSRRRPPLCLRRS